MLNEIENRRSGKNTPAMRYKKRQSWLMDVSLFAELEEELGLIGKITFMFPLAWQQRRAGAFWAFRPIGVDSFLKGHRLGVGGGLCLIVAGGIAAGGSFARFHVPGG